MYAAISSIEKDSEVKVSRRDAIEDRSIAITCGAIYFSVTEDEAASLVKQLSDLLK